jgi:hypothetical protein
VPLRTSKRAQTIGACCALLAHGALSAFALFGWISSGGRPWAWKSVVTGVCAVLSFVLSGLLWHTPTRSRAALGALVLLASLARVGPPGDWTWVSFKLVAATFVLLLPVLHATTAALDDRS